VCVEHPVASPNVWQEIRLSEKRYIQTVTIIGSGPSDFTKSTNWVLTVGDLTGDQAVYNTEIMQFADIDDRFGKQFMVKMFAYSVLVYRTDDLDLQLRGLLLTTTATDCTDKFVWTTDFKKDAVTRLSIDLDPRLITGIMKSTISDCAIAHVASMSDMRPLPDFISYDQQTNMMTVNVTSSVHVGQYEVMVMAYNNDKVTPFKQEFVKHTFDMYSDI
jgi:hypothetical protein